MQSATKPGTANSFAAICIPVQKRLLQIDTHSQTNRCMNVGWMQSTTYCFSTNLWGFSCTLQLDKTKYTIYAFHTISRKTRNSEFIRCNTNSYLYHYSYPFINEYTYEHWVDAIHQKFAGEQTVELHPHYNRPNTLFSFSQIIAFIPSKSILL
jgi:hypothetical protein